MSFNVNVELKKLKFALTDVVDNLELYIQHRSYYNSIQNVFGVIESSFSEGNTYNYYNNDRVKQIIYEHIENLYDIIDNIYDDHKFSTQLKENTLAFKDLLEDFEKNIKKTK
jgi:hypothetical protein